MSDEKKPAKRGYCVGGSPLAYDLRVRISETMHGKLKEYAVQHGISPAAAAREILSAALIPDEK